MDPAQLDELARRAQGGSREAFRALVEAVQEPLRACIAAHAAHPHQIDEALQETLVTAFRRLDQYRPEGTLVPWLKQIARNHLRRDLRDRRRFAGLDEDALDAAVIGAQLDKLESEEAVGERERAVERLRRCLARLPDQLRGLVEAHHFAGAPLADLAARLNRSANWLAVTLFRARKALAECVAKEDSGGV